jgi:hypothetical protein
MARCDSHHSPKVTVLARDFSEEGTVPYTRLEPNWRNPMKVEASDRPDKSFYMLNRILQDTAPVETTKLRLRLPVPPTDVPRLAEIVVHGQAL